jgi:hypothetical protein
MKNRPANWQLLFGLQGARDRVTSAREAVAEVLGSGEEQGPPQPMSRRDEEVNEIYIALNELSEPLASSYLQVKKDLDSPSRISWAGTAHEIREILATLLRLLAPDGEVKTQKWYAQEPNTSGPTQKQRVRLILQRNGAGSKAEEVVTQVVRLEDMLGDLVRATYSRASDAAHRFKTKREVKRILTYFEAFATDLLNLE